MKSAKNRNKVGLTPKSTMNFLFGVSIVAVARKR